jgi:hypothetical protein
MRQALAGDLCPLMFGYVRPQTPLPKLVLGVTFNDGIEVIAKPTDRLPITAAA